ncbi:DUF3019 domain-containing protein [Shewanella eurypsychrophilus]|uniref:DUF3019 domain-containing protein n=1 Tax=Shewanella eurypsychrophilus TaxID=2593656 RepID=A0ABX6V5N7_9GAMM|nr:MULTISPECIES: DUF3019 domain-containing protein [Shewanella]QFU21881.1 DUF3019 domain-containing protein [Shewanella sp. YLB-09]QPG57170.1 DUF3019 domain-containing protein [Shewanella eurypsychrophilus]
MNKFNNYLALILLGGPMTAWSQDNSIAFTATPKRCIALHKGQTCYQDVLFRWQTPQSGQYCLVLNKDQRKLTCWNGKAIQEYQYSFEGDKTTTFSLIHKDETQPLAQLKVVVTWVYKAPKQSGSGWRLF